MSLLKKSAYAFYDVMVTKKMSHQRTVVDLINDCNHDIPQAEQIQLISMLAHLETASAHMNNAARVMK